jgi:hypothetical protein
LDLDIDDVAFISGALRTAAHKFHDDAFALDTPELRESHKRVRDQFMRQFERARMLAMLLESDAGV